MKFVPTAVTGWNMTLRTNVMSVKYAVTAGS